jgi:hypothetical protein
MRTKQLTFFALTAIAVASILSTGCKKNNNSTPNPYKTDSLSATVNGSAFLVTGSEVYGFYDTTRHSWSVTAFRTTDSVGIALSISDSFVVNKPVTTPGSAAIEYLAQKGSYDNYIGAGNTTITVTLLDTVNHKIAGTFSGDLYGNTGTNDSVVVTSGKFNVAYLVSQPH